MVDLDQDDHASARRWLTCQYRRGEGDSPCDGRRVDGFARCLAHLKPEQLERVLRGLGPGADLKVPGTDISSELLARILGAVTNEGQTPIFGSVDFTEAHFIDDATFRDVRFSGDALFSGAKFSGDVLFYSAQFSKEASFGDAHFSGRAFFPSANFAEGVWFHEAQFEGNAEFSFAVFGSITRFHEAEFRGDANFSCQVRERPVRRGTLRRVRRVPKCQIQSWGHVH